MLRRSLSLFTALAVATLGIVAIYALLEFRGPEDDLADARAALEQGRLHDVVRRLNTVESSPAVRSSTALRRQLHETRYRAHIGLGNSPRALDDIQGLIGAAGKDVERWMLHEEVRLLTAVNEPDRALERVQELIASDAVDGRAFELRGEATQIRYQTHLRGIVEVIDRELAGANAEDAHRALRQHLYPPNGDPAVVSGLSRLRKHFSGIGAQVGDVAFLAAVESTREEVQRCLADYWRALELPSDTDPVSSYRGLSHALRQGERPDDVALLARIYLQRFDHRYTTEAAADLAAMHLESGRPGAAVRAAGSYLADWEARADADKLDPAVGRLLVTLLLAHRERNVVKGVLSTAQLAGRIHQRVPLGGLIHWFQGMAAWANKNPAGVKHHLETYLKTLGPRIRQEPLDGPDLASIAIQTWIQSEAETKTQTLLHDRWVELRPRSAEAWLARSRFRLQEGNSVGAHDDAKKAAALLPEDETILRAVANAAEERYAESGANGVGLVNRAIRQGSPDPRPQDPIGYLLAARTAKATGKAWPIVRVCARRASDAFLWALEPRILEAEACLAMDSPADAVEVLEAARSFHSGSQELLDLLRRAQVAAGSDSEDLLMAELESGRATPSGIAQLIDVTLKRGPTDALIPLGARALRVPSPTPEVLAAAAKAAATVGSVGLANKLITRIPPEADPTLTLQALEAVLLVQAKDLPDEQLRRALRRILTLARRDAGGALEIVKKLVKLDRPASAYELLTEILAAGEHTQRTGEHFALAGDLAMRTGRPAAAFEHYLAAISFEGGSDAAMPLIVMLLERGDEERASEVLALRDRSVPLPIAVRWRLGQTRAAAAAAKRQLKERPHDLEARAFAALAQPEAEADTDLQTLATNQAELLAATFLWLPHEGYAAKALEDARALQAAAPDSMFAKLLLARALGRAGGTPEAVKLLDGIVKTGDAPWALHHVVAEIIPGDNPRVLTPRLQATLIAGAVSPEGEILPIQAVQVARLVAAQALAAKQRDQAILALVEAWRRFPVESGVRLADVRTLSNTQQFSAAVQVLLAMEPQLDAAEKSEFLELYFLSSAALAFQQGNDTVRRAAVAKANELIERDGAWGAAVRFLVTDDEVRQGPLAEDTSPRAAVRRTRRVRQARAVLEFHLDGTHQSATDLQWAILEVSAWSSDNDAGLLELLRKLSDYQPANPLFRVARAHIHDRTGQPEEAVRELRSFVSFVPDERASALVASIAAREGIEVADDQSAIGPWNPKAPANVRFAQGLLGFRAGKYQLTVEALEALPPAPTRDWFLAQAYVARNSDGDAAKALRLLQAVAPDSQSDSAANAEHFAAQLQLMLTEPPADTGEDGR